MTPGGDKVIRAKGISTSSPGARIDMSNNSIILDSGAAPVVAGVREQLRTGYNSGLWNGTGINSGTAAANPGHSIGYALATDLFTSFPATFMGEPVDATALLLNYTRTGDANLDGVVNLRDFNRLAANFGNGDTWFKGDFNFDGITSLVDFDLLAANFGFSASSGGPTPADWAALATLVPEPGCAAAIAIVGLALPRRRTTPPRPA
jgi:hypothetical protein